MGLRIPETTDLVEGAWAAGQTANSRQCGSKKTPKCAYSSVQALYAWGRKKFLPADYITYMDNVEACVHASRWLLYRNFSLSYIFLDKCTVELVETHSPSANSTKQALAGGS